MSAVNNPIENYPNAFLATHLSNLAASIHELSKNIFAEYGISVDPKCVSVLMFVSANQRASASDIARSLGISHQLVTQRINKLERSGYVSCLADKNDARRRVVRATRRGTSEVKRIEPVLAALERRFEAVSIEAGVHLPTVLRESLRLIRRETTHS